MENSNSEHTDEELRILDSLKNVGITSQKTVPNTIPGQIPAGSYLSTITQVTKTTHPDGNYDIVKMDITIQGGQYSGFVLTKYYHQKTRKAIEFFKREMGGIGFQVADRQALEGLCNLLVDTNVIADVVPNDSGNQAVYLKNANTKKTVAPIDPDGLWID